MWPLSGPQKITVVHAPCSSVPRRNYVGFLERRYFTFDLFRFLVLKDQTVRVEIGAGALVGGVWPLRWAVHEPG